ncbi:hypothetical protein ACFX12_010133 [Malus domestica]
MVYVDYTDLNKTYMNDSYPVHQIDIPVDSTSGNQLFNFLDAYSNYNQIDMHEADKEKTVFVIKRGTYCYKVMHFDLKEAIYQRLVNMMFKK